MNANAAIGRALGLPGVESELDLARQVEQGLPVRSGRRVSTLLSLDRAEVDRLIAPRRRLDRHATSRGTLTRQESERVVQLARVAVLAGRVFQGQPDYATHWLREAKQALDGQAPLDLMVTETGARAVEGMLVGIEHGQFA